MGASHQQNVQRRGKPPKQGATHKLCTRTAEGDLPTDEKSCVGSRFTMCTDCRGGLIKQPGGVWRLFGARGPCMTHPHIKAP